MGKEDCILDSDSYNDNFNLLPRKVLLKRPKERKEGIEQASIGGALLLIVLLLIVLIFVWWHYSTKMDDYSMCADGCVSDNYGCFSSALIYDKSRNGYVPYLDFEDCSSNLEMCITDCNE